MNDINHRIKEVLNRSGLTAAEFAEALRVQRSSISHILSGRNKPSLDFITKLHSAFPNVDLTYLITGEESAVAQPLEPTVDADRPEPTHMRKTSIAENNVTSVNEKEPTPRVTFVNKSESVKLNQTENEELPATSSVTPSNRVSKIILLYEDGRFQEFTP
jgi:transcriptional regulator with XRE-family HTH domain